MCIWLLCKLHGNKFENINGYFSLKIWIAKIDSRSIWIMLSLNEARLKKYILFNVYEALGNSLAVQCLGLHASTTGGTGSIPSQGTKIPHFCMPHGAAKKKKVYETLE